MAADATPSPAASPRYRKLRRAATLAALGTAALFGAVIAALPEPPVLLHEIAGLLLLLVLLAVALGAAHADRPAEARATVRLLAALGALLVMGGVGAALAQALRPGPLDQLPLAILVVFGVLLADSLREGPRPSGRAASVPG